MLPVKFSAKGSEKASNTSIVSEGREEEEMKMEEEASNSILLEEFHDALDGNHVDIKEVPPVLEDAPIAPSDPTEEEGQEEGGCRKQAWFQCFDRLSRKRPRIWAMTIGLFFPLFLLICLAVVCGYPLALLESPLELEHNDYVMEQQLRLLTEASFYTNITQSLPRICLSLYFQNATAEEFLKNLTKITRGPPDMAQYYILDDWEGWQENAAKKLDLQEDLLQEGILLQEVEQEFINGTFQEGNLTINYTPAELSVPLLTPTFESALGLPPIPEGYEVRVNLTEMSMWLVNCGVDLSPMIDQMFVNLVKTINLAFDGMSFAWTICPTNDTRRTDTMNYSLGSAFQEDVPSSFLWDLFVDSIAPQGWENFHEYIALDAQSAHYRQRWEWDRQRLYKKYLRKPAMSQRLNATIDALSLDFSNDTFTNSSDGNETEPEVGLARQIWAFELSLQHATGREGCTPHVPAACWFWFTVMTTIGYGNTSPSTTGGKAMVYTLGFVTLLLFGGVSARAGYVVSSLLEDLLIRSRSKVLVHPAVTTIIWGAVYYLWMVIIAVFYIWWQKNRLGFQGEDELSIGYWFAYISTTTVGFGDYVLEPEVFVWWDLATYPLMFLLGFSFLAAFLTQLAELIRGPFQDDGESLVARFKKSDDDRELRKGTVSKPS